MPRQFKRIPLSCFVPNPANVRTEYDQALLLALGQSLKKHGQKQPLRVRPLAPDPATGEERYLLLGGERRYRGALLVGLDALDCEVVAGELSEADAVEDQLVENQFQEHLSPMDEARAYQRLMTLHAITVSQLAVRLDLSESRISKRLTLRRLPPDVQQWVHAGTLDFSCAYPIARLTNPDRMRELAKQCLGPPPLTKAVIEAIVAAELDGQAAKATKLRLSFEVDAAAGYDGLRQVATTLTSKVQQLEKAGVKPARGVEMICRKEV